MDLEIELEESSTNRIAQRFEFPFCNEDDLPKSEIHRVESNSDYSSYVTNLVTFYPDRLESFERSDEGLGLRNPLSSPSKLHQDNCHHADQIPVTSIMATPASNQTRNTALNSTGSEIKSTGIV
jgi:hypothetical protein